MKPNSASPGREKSPGTSDFSPYRVQPRPLHREGGPPPTVQDSKSAHPSPLRALTELAERAGFPDFIIASPVMLDLIDFLDQIRNSSAPLLITGETGVGKEIMAQAAHALSNRCKHDFVAFNCASSSQELIESRLFGHVRGSFTGAHSNFKGTIRDAVGGTILLDEIGELSMEMQPKFLRFLQEGEIHPLGMARPIKVDVRIIAATNRNLEEEVDAGRFRADVFARLNALRLHIPPLRERREEIPLLIAYFMDRFQKELQKYGMMMGDEAMALLCGSDWPLNIRQLEHEILRLVARTENNRVIGVDHISPEILAISAPRRPTTPPEGKVSLNLDLSYREARDEMERQFIIHALQATNDNLSKAADRLKMNRSGLRKAIERLGIDLERKPRGQFSV